MHISKFHKFGNTVLAFGIILEFKFEICNKSSSISSILKIEFSVKIVFSSLKKISEFLKQQREREKRFQNSFC